MPEQQQKVTLLTLTADPQRSLWTANGGVNVSAVGLSTILLMKHGRPRIRRWRAASTWKLSSRGARETRGSIPALARVHPQWVAASDEPKARETGRIVSRALGVEFLCWPDLREQDNTGVAYLDAAEFDQQVKRLLEDPSTRFGTETGLEALSRFESALLRLTAEQSGNGIVVSHGRVITLLLARHNAIDPFAFWKSFALGATVQVRARSWQLISS